MTENQFQQARKVMQQANHLRGLITKEKGEVARWTAMEDANRRDMKHSQADGCKKLVEKSIKKLESLRQKFREMKFPDEDAKPTSVWIAALCHDSFNYLPKEIKEVDVWRAKEEGHTLHTTLQAAQNECDQLNSL